MKRSKYKFEEYDNRNFPVYSSVQKGQKNLVMPHFHEEVEFIKILSGIVCAYSGTHTYNCSSGDILFYPPFTLHEVCALTPDAAIEGIVFHTSLLKQPISYTLKRGECRIFEQDDPDYEKMNALFQTATSLYAERPPLYELEISAYLLLLICVLAQKGIAVLLPENNSCQRIQPVLDYIAKNFENPIHISDLCKILNVSKEHLIRLFKAATSKTPTEYITDFRIAEAMKLLNSDRYSIAEISEKLTFATPSYFSKIFKERLKMTPTEYRKKINNDKALNLAGDKKHL